jgi:hypothetical protein
MDKNIFSSAGKLEYTYGRGKQYGDGSKILVIDDLRRFKIGGNLSMKVGTVTFEELLVKDDDGTVEKWGDDHPIIKFNRFVKILGMECWWIPLAEAERAAAAKGYRVVVSGGKARIVAS